MEEQGHDSFFTNMVTGVVEEEDVPRDGMKRYLLPDPQTGEIKGRTRVTTVSGSMENNFSLGRWEKRLIVRGMGLRADLMARAGAANPDDDGYDTLLDSIVVAAFEAAGGSWGSNLGTAQHKAFERHFLHGTPIEELPEYFHADLRAVRAALEFHGITLLPQYIERTVYNELYDRGGKVDAIAQLADGTLAILDLKTEKDPAKYPEGKTVQLAYYANSKLIMNYETQQYEPMPSVHTDFALIVWCRPGTGEAQILQVPIDIGWVGVRIAEQNRAWRRQKIVITPYLSQANWAATPPVTSQATTDGQTFSGGNDSTPSLSELLGCAVCGAQESRGDQHAERCPLKPQLPAPEPAMHPANEQPQGNYAQVAAVVDGALQSGQQLDSTQVQHLNQQAAEIVAGNAPRTNSEAGLPPAPSQPPGQPVVGTGTGHPVTAGIHAAETPLSGVPADRPPAPKGTKAKKMSPAERLQELLAVPPYIEGTNGTPGQGINPEAEAEELAEVDKTELQEMLKTIDPSIDEKSLKKWRKTLAEMLVERLAKQRQLRANTAPQATETPVQDTPQVQVTPAQVTQPGWAQVGPVAAGGPPPPFNGTPQNPQDLTVGGMIAQLNMASDVNALVTLYQQWVSFYGAEQWVQPLQDAYWQRHAQITSISAPVG